MQKKTVSFFSIILYIVGLATIFSAPIWAEATTDSQGAKGFSFEVIRPENQHNNEVSYFDLRMTPGQKQTVQLKLLNTSDKEITVNVALNSAKTNSNGVIEYGPNTIPNDETLKYDFSEIVKAPEEVNVEPKSEKMLEIEITMPDTEIAGYISGGIQLQEQDQAGKATKQEQGMIVNKIAYLVGMLLSTSDVDQIKPDLTLNKVYPELDNYRNAIIINFSNVQPVYVNDMTTEVEIMKKNSEEVIYSTKKSKMRMAPNSRIDFPVSMNGEKMLPGDYRAKILVTTLDGGRWEWDQVFKITSEEADKFNEKDLSLVQEKGIDWKVILIIAGSLLLVLLIIFFVSRKVRKKREVERKRRKKFKKIKGK